MKRTHSAHLKVAFLATGDELTQGDIQNSNTQIMARDLFSNGIPIGFHLIVPDIQTEIEQAIYYLLDSHAALIITGGLGPTSDDLTRFALSEVLKSPLVFDEPSWEAIKKRALRFGIKTPPESNRQQALFPENGNIIPNPNGTAAGYWVTHQEKFIFMLPGPPRECLPMFEKVVIPELKNAGFPENFWHRKWLVFGVSEAKIAEELDLLAKPFQCITGYRLCYPYLEFKLHSTHHSDFSKLAELVEQTIQPYILSDAQIPASKVLLKNLRGLQKTIGICDHATGGILEATLKTPETASRIIFASDASLFPIDLTWMEINGLTDFWQNHLERRRTTLTITYHTPTTERTQDFEIPMHADRDRVKLYALEFLSHKIDMFIREINH